MRKKTRIVVSVDGSAGPYIIVEAERLNEVSEVLEKNRWPYAVDRNAVQSSECGGDVIIELGYDADVDAIQQALDEMCNC